MAWWGINSSPGLYLWVSWCRRKTNLTWLAHSWSDAFWYSNREWQDEETGRRAEGWRWRAITIKKTPQLLWKLKWVSAFCFTHVCLDVFGCAGVWIYMCLSVGWTYAYQDTTAVVKFQIKLESRFGKAKIIGWKWKNKFNGDDLNPLVRFF